MRAVSFIWGEMKTIANENWARDIISWKHLTIGRPVLPVFPRAQSLIPDLYSVLFTDSVEGQQLQHLMILPLLRSMASTHGKCQFVGDRSMFPPLETGGNMIVGWLWCCVTARASSQKASTEALDLFEFSFLSLLAALFISDCLYLIGRSHGFGPCDVGQWNPWKDVPGQRATSLASFIPVLTAPANLCLQSQKRFPRQRQPTKLFKFLTHRNHQTP